ncbi:MAG TPA: NUDIX domain-containing protein [Pirellulales bacterium]|nr:NUDIX domain-containing protein [Pirellulales bacterium]
MPAITEKPTVVAIAVVEHQGQFLVGRRPLGAPLAGLAEFPGGKVEATEAPEAAAVRECQEESGIAVQVLGKYLSTLYRYDHGLLEVHFFRCRPVDAGGNRVSPNAPFHWTPAEKLATLEFPAANAPLTEILLREAKVVRTET